MNRREKADDFGKQLLKKKFVKDEGDNYVSRDKKLMVYSGWYSKNRKIARRLTEKERRALKSSEVFGDYIELSDMSKEMNEKVNKRLSDPKFVEKDASFVYKNDGLFREASIAGYEDYYPSPGDWDYDDYYY